METVRRHMQSFGTNWAFAGKVAAMRHLRSIGVNRPVKIKEIQVVIPLKDRFDVQLRFFLKGYRPVNKNNSNTHFTVRRGDEIPVVVYTRATMPRTVSYGNKTKFVVLNGVPNKSPAIQSLKNFHRTIRNLNVSINN